MSELMDHETEPTTAEGRAGALAERLFGAGLAAIDIFTVYLGLRLGLYTVLAEQGPVTSSELASSAGIAERYAQEWLEQQTVTGIVECVDRTAPADGRRYVLPAGHDVVLLDADSPACLAPVALAAAGIAGVLPQLLEAYRTGRGVPYAAYGTDFRDGQAGFNRPAFVNLLTDEWLATGLPEISARLSRGERLRVADVACGAGWASIALARAHPAARIEGFDVDEASILDARRNAEEAGLSGQLTFEVLDAGDLPHGRFDLVCVFEAVHDMSRPIEVLRAIRRAVADGGAVLVMDERAAETFAESEGPIEAFLYGASVLHCLPVGMSEQPSAATGTVMRTDTMRQYARAAGFADAEVLPIEHDLFRFYRLV
jgi:2-polyprenyl-3-methyl-5-hydroxy-6-metoxy-1,4-benzoquinol methylase